MEKRWSKNQQTVAIAKGGAATPTRPSMFNSRESIELITDQQQQQRCRWMDLLVVLCVLCGRTDAKTLLLYEWMNDQPIGDHNETKQLI